MQFGKLSVVSGRLAACCLWQWVPAAWAQNNGAAQTPAQPYPPSGGYAQAPYLPPGYAPAQGYYGGAPAQPAWQPPPSLPANSGQSKALPTVGQWFTVYDRIRHDAQMSPSERQRADALMSKGMSILMPGDEKVAAKALLTQMVTRYTRACQQLRNLPIINQTAGLQHVYYDYFATAGQLFSDYVRVQDNLFITDAATGQPLAAELLQRKQMLEALEHQAKQVDAQTRHQFGIPPFPF